MSFLPNFSVETNYVAILDTNCYRTLSKGLSEPEIIERAGLLRAAEARHHIQAAVPVIAALELIESLVEGEKGFNYADCLTGLIGLGYHCNENDEAGPRILPPSFVNIARSFFVPDQEAEADVKNVGGVIVGFK